MTILILIRSIPALWRHFPWPRPADKIAYGMDLTMRFIPTISRDFTLTMDAQRARGYEIESFPRPHQQVRKLAPLIVPVTVRALAGSEDIIDAMDLRAFGIGVRTWLIKLDYVLRDRFLIGFGIMLLTASVALSIQGIGKFWVPDFLLASPINNRQVAQQIARQQAATQQAINSAFSTAQNH